MTAAVTLSSRQAKLLFLLSGMAAPRIGQWLSQLPFILASSIGSRVAPETSIAFYAFRSVEFYVLGGVLAAVAFGAVFRGRDAIRWAMIGYALSLAPGILIVAVQEAIDASAGNNGSEWSEMSLVDLSLVLLSPGVVTAAFALVPAINAFRKWRPA